MSFDLHAFFTAVRARVNVQGFLYFTALEHSAVRAIFTDLLTRLLRVVRDLVALAIHYIFWQLIVLGRVGFVGCDNCEFLVYEHKRLLINVEQ
jgi:hypothetical protein